MEKRKDIELSPYEYQGDKFRVFLTHDDKFASSIECVGHLVADSRAELEAGIEKHVRDFLGLFGQPGLVPIMRIDSNATDGFGLSRFRVILPTKGLYSWHTHQKLSVHWTSPLPDTFPTKLAELPFVDTTERDWVYYALYKKRVWYAFTKLNEDLKHRFAINKGAILAELTEGHYSLSQSLMETQLYKDYVWRPFL